MKTVDLSALDEVHATQEQQQRVLTPANLFSRDPELAFQEAERLVGVVAKPRHPR